MASTPFGEHLRRERELRGVTLDEVSAATRIKTSFLEAIENGRWEQLPGGAFNRGFIRATSRFLGLDEDGMVAEYALETGAVVQIRPVDEPNGAMPRDYRPAAIAGSMVLLVVIAGAWLGHHEYWLRKQKHPGVSGGDASQPLSGSANSQSNSTLSGAPAAGSGAADPPANANSPSSAAMNSIAPDPPPGATGAATTAAPPAAGSATATDPLSLKIESSKRAEVRVVGDGKTLFKGRLRSDVPKVFQAHENFEVSSGETDRVRLELNGQAVPFNPPSGHKGKISLSRKDLKSAGQPSH